MRFQVLRCFSIDERVDLFCLSGFSGSSSFSMGANGLHVSLAGLAPEQLCEITGLLILNQYLFCIKRICIVRLLCAVTHHERLSKAFKAFEKVNGLENLSAACEAMKGCQRLPIF